MDAVYGHDQEYDRSDRDQFMNGQEQHIDRPACAAQPHPGQDDKTKNIPASKNLLFISTPKYRFLEENEIITTQAPERPRCQPPVRFPAGHWPELHPEWDISGR